MTSNTAKIYLYGAFRIEDRHGRRVPLQSTKAQGLLALLATSPKGERSRPWLQSMLWSDRGPEQASGSMRQALTQLRKILEPTGIALEVDRRRVAFDLATVHLVDTTDGEFLEGLDVRDEEFEAWLTAERSRRSGVRVRAELSPELPTEPTTPPWSLSIVSQTLDHELKQWFDGLVADSIALSLREIYSAGIQVGPVEEMRDWALVARIQSFITRPGSVGIRITIEHPSRSRQVCAGFRDLPSKSAPPIDHPDFQQMVNELIDALGDYLILWGAEPLRFSDPDRLFRLAIRTLFSMDPSRVVDADNLLSHAQDNQPRGLYHAWRMQLRAIQLIEKHPIDVAAVKEEGRRFFARAMELEPNNSMVLASLANSLRLFDRDDAHSLFLAERSVRINPGNSFAWWSLSAASGYKGDTKGAYQNALTARRLAILSPHRFWWDSQVYTAALLSGRTAEALKFAEATHAGNPEFKPPLRYLVALYANAGNVEGALEAVAKLRRLEPDFTVERLIKDPAYPASMIHAAPNLSLERIAELI